MEDFKRLIEIIDNSEVLLAKMDEDELNEETYRLCLAVRMNDSSQTEDFLKIAEFVEYEGYKMGIDPDICWRESLIPSLCAIYSSFPSDDPQRRDFSQKLTEQIPSLGNRGILEESEYIDCLLTQAIESGDERMIEWLTSEWCEWYMYERWPEGLFGAAMLHELLKSDVEPQDFIIDSLLRFASSLEYSNPSQAINTFINNIFEKLSND